MELKEYSCFFKMKQIRKNSYIYIVIIMIIKMLPIFTERFNGLDYFFSCIQGFSGKSINIVNIFYDMTYYVYPIVIVSYLLENEKQHRNILVKFRYRSFRNWNKFFFDCCTRFIVVYNVCFWLMQIGITVVLQCLLCNRKSVYWNSIMSIYQIKEQEMFVRVGLIILFHIIELFILTELIYLLCRVLKSTISAFFVVIFGDVILLLSELLDDFWGLSSFYSLVEKNDEEIILALIFNIVTHIILFILRRILWKQ